MSPALQAQFADYAAFHGTPGNKACHYVAVPLIVLTVFALDGGMLFGLHTHMGAESKDQADERRTGLDHISFGLKSSTELEQWQDRLNELGIANGGIKKAHYGSGISFRDPDNIALEFFIAPGT